MSTLDHVHHIALPVADLAQSLAWYTSSFTCEVAYQDQTQAILQFENIRIVLVLPSQQRSHIAYLRADAATLGELREQVDGIKSTFIADPTGNPVELVAKGTP